MNIFYIRTMLLKERWFTTTGSSQLNESDNQYQIKVLISDPCVINRDKTNFFKNKK